MIIINVILLTTLLILLYPPLKGFSQIKIHVYVRVSCLPVAFQGVLKPRAFEMLHKIEFEGKMVLKGAFARIIEILAL